jgi:hypothetical protein
LRLGIYPSIRVGEKGKIAVLTMPALQILRGERPPGPAKADEPASTTRRLRGETRAAGAP